MKTLNLGIVAHVDAGKTSLTERLLFNAGVIRKMGSVDNGSTQTDSLELERERGITIQAGVVSFHLDDLVVNLIDTPGHSDFIGEVERALTILDGVILVISAVEGIQTQTRVLMQTLRKLNIPTLLFVNKIDRRGACEGLVVDHILKKLTSHAIAMNTVYDVGTPQATVSSLFHDATDVAAQTVLGRCHPIFFGSAITGAGIAELLWGIHYLLPSKTGSVDGPLQGTIFKIERGSNGEKIAYLRLYSGKIRVRQPLTLYRNSPSNEVQTYKEKVTAIYIIENSKNNSVDCASAGHIAKVEGLQNARIGDRLHLELDVSQERLFPPPTLEMVLFVEDKVQEPRLYAALQSMSEQDPWINARVDPIRHEIAVSLYGEVQKEVIQVRLEREFGLEAQFKDPTTIYIERVVSPGEALQEIHRKRHNEFYATIGLKVEPGQPGSGVVYRLGVEKGCIPKSYHTAIKEAVLETLKLGLYGWEIIDCIVTLTKAGICPLSTVSDFRKLTPLVLMSAIQQAKTCVCEPICRFELVLPSPVLSSVITKLAEGTAVLEHTEINDNEAFILGKIPSNRVHAIERALPAITQGKAVFISRFEGYDPVKGKIPRRKIFDGSLVDRRKLRLISDK